MLVKASPSSYAASPFTTINAHSTFDSVYSGHIGVQALFCARTHANTHSHDYYFNYYYDCRFEQIMLMYYKIYLAKQILPSTITKRRWQQRRRQISRRDVELSLQISAIYIYIYVYIYCTSSDGKTKIFCFNTSQLPRVLVFCIHTRTHG